MNKQCFYGIDLLRGLSAFFIVGCHLGYGSTNEGVGRLLQFCDAGVAVFGILAGFFFVRGSSSDYFSAIKKRVSRVLIPYAIATIGFTLMGLVFAVLSHKELGRYSTLEFWFSVVFRGGSAAHLWFLIWLFYFEMILYPVKFLHKSAWRGIVFCCLGCAALFVSVTGAMCFRYESAIGNTCFYAVRLLGLLFLGMSLSDFWGLPCRIFGEGERFLLRGGGILIALISLAGVACYVKMPCHLFYRESVLALSLIVCALSIKITNSKVICLGEILATTSMGVYLVHPAVTAVLHEMIKRLALDRGSILTASLHWVSAWAISLGLTMAYYRLRRGTLFARKFVMNTSIE